MILVQSLGILFFVLGLILLLSIFGDWLASGLGLPAFPESQALKFAQSFVIAVSLLLLVLTVGSLIGLGARWTVFPVLAGLLGFGIRQAWSGNFRFPQEAFLTILFFVFVNGYRALRIPGFDPNYSHQNPFAGVGNLNHSFRAGNISTYIHQHDQVPLLNQHTGQSILAALPSTLGLHAPQFTLMLWQGILLGVLSLAAYGLLRFLTTRTLAILGVAVLLFINSAVYSAQLNFTDNADSPLFFCSNDAAFGIITFLYAFFVGRRILYQAKTSPTGPLVAIGLIVAAWNVYATQNIPVYLVLVALLGAFQPNLATMKRAVFLGCVVAVGAVGGKSLGGMFNSHYDVEAAAAIPGMMQFSNEKELKIIVTEPRVKFFLSGERLSALALLSQLRPLIPNNYHLGLDYNELRDWAQLKIYLQKAWSNFFNWSGRILALSDLMLLALLQLCLLRLFDPPNYLRWAAFMPFRGFCCVLAFFLVCLTIPSIVVMNGYSWEMSRFFYAALFMAKGLNVALFVLTIRGAIQGSLAYKAYAVGLSLLMVILITPVLANYQVYFTQNNFTVFTDRLALFIRTNEMVTGK